MEDKHIVLFQQGGLMVEEVTAEVIEMNHLKLRYRGRLVFVEPTRYRMVQIEDLTIYYILEKAGVTGE